MPNTKPEYRHRHIIWAYLRTAKGKRAEHPAVILSPDKSIVQPEDFDPRSGTDNVVVVAGISTKYRTHSNPYVQLPFAATQSGHRVTGLRKDSAAIVGWYQTLFIPDDVTAFSGDVPVKEMQALSTKILTDYIATVGDQYVTSLEMLAELREILIANESRRN